MTHKREYTVETEYTYDRASPARWIVSHALRYPHLPAGMVLLGILSTALGTQAPVALGRAFDHVLSPGRNARTLLLLSLSVLGFWMGQAALDVIHRVFSELLSRRVQRDAREELFVHLLGKSLAFHSRQQVGDLMARATDDPRTLNYMFSPTLRGFVLWVAQLSLVVVTIGTIHPHLALVPLVFVIALAWTLYNYIRQFAPIAEAQRAQFGVMSARLAQSISGIEVVKSSVQEGAEWRRFRTDASRWRDLYVRWGEILAQPLPLLVYDGTLAFGFVHALVLYVQGMISLGEVIALMGLLGQLEATTVSAVGMFSLFTRGVASARRILDVVNAETELDENPAGVARPMRGEVSFENVSFAYDSNPVLCGISFRAHPGETIAIVGQTGSGKTTLVRLVNRIYDACEGRVLVDGVDVRRWNLTSLRSQVSTIEQDVFLFARSIGENIAFGAGREVAQGEIERCAREAEADEFIARLERGYETIVGERGVMLSGGQRQRVAIARAFLADPRILILDDSTSAIDSATEDRIQTAMRRVSAGRTTFLITHRLSQIRRADRILILRRGELLDQGTHEELMQRCATYRRLFARKAAERRPTTDDGRLSTRAES